MARLYSRQAALVGRVDSSRNLDTRHGPRSSAKKISPSSRDRDFGVETFSADRAGTRWSTIPFCLSDVLLSHFDEIVQVALCLDRADVTNLHSGFDGSGFESHLKLECLIGENDVVCSLLREKFSFLPSADPPPTHSDLGGPTRKFR